MTAMRAAPSGSPSHVAGGPLSPLDKRTDALGIGFPARLYTSDVLRAARRPVAD